MKRFFNTILVLAGLAAAASCTDNIGPELREESGVLTISLSSAQLETKATADGIDNLNENAIRNIHYFLYKKDETSSNALKSGHVTTNRNRQETINVNVGEDELNKVLFPKKENLNECDVFLIVNLPEGVTIDEDNTSVAELEKIAIEASFNSQPESFVMTGLGTAKIVDRKKSLAATGTINVDRIASKITVKSVVSKSITIGTETWVSQPAQMKLMFCNGQSKALLSAVPSAAERVKFNSPASFSDAEFLEQTETSATSTTWEGNPFYSYPVKWDAGDNNDEPFIFVMLPWARQDGSSREFRPCYYKLFLNSNAIEKNTWYDITLKLSVLGSFHEEEPKVILNSMKYKVCNWSTFEFSTSINAARFLVVDESSYVMNNVNTIDIPFLTSHPCEIVNVTVTQKNIKDTAGDKRITSGYDCSIVTGTDDKGNTTYAVRYSKPLDNNYLSKNFDFTPYTITFRVRHKDAPASFYEDITIIQYPAIYGLNESNSDFDWNNQSQTNHNNDKNTLVNGYRGTYIIGKQDFFGTCTGFPGSSNTSNYSPYMYVFTVTSLEGTDYVIGDPRTTEIDKDLVNAVIKYRNGKSGTAWYQGPALYDNSSNRGLRYYYPTLNDESTRNVIAPKFRIASSYGVLYTGTAVDQGSAAPDQYLDGMRKRCASYQEDGYPAGRWRLPTEAEFKFIVSQVNKGTLPSIYVPKTPYWCAHGYAMVDDKGNVTMTYNETAKDSYSTRCVYDEWYWENVDAQYRRLTNKGTFTWGDMPR